MSMCSKTSKSLYIKRTQDIDVHVNKKHEVTLTGKTVTWKSLKNAVYPPDSKCLNVKSIMSMSMCPEFTFTGNDQWIDIDLII